MLEEEIERLPFLGTADLVERIAKKHHRLLEHHRQLERETMPPTSAAFDTGSNASASWWQLLQAGRRAVRLVSAQIASAHSVDAAAGAGQRHMYFDALEEIERTLLAVAARELSRPPSPEFSPERFIGIASYGRRTVNAGLEVIPPRHWEAGDMDWTARRLTVCDGTIWTGVRVLDLEVLSFEANMFVGGSLCRASSATASAPTSGAPGRPSSMHLVLAEHDRRAASGQTESSRTREAEALEQWLRQAHPDARPVTAKTIRNKLPATFQPQAEDARPKL